MDQNFSLMAQSRANYYTAGSPVQFVRVELLKGDVTGEVPVWSSISNVRTPQARSCARTISITSSSMPSPARSLAVTMLSMSAIRRSPAWRSSRTVRS